MIDQQQIRALAYLAARMRPSGSTPWDEPGVVAALAKVAHLNLAEVVMATTRAATNPDVKSPGVIPVLTGEHWRERVVPRTHPHPLRPEEACRRCGGIKGDCHCTRERLAADHDDDPNPRADHTTDPRALAHAEMARAKARLCGCGVRAEVCPVHREPEETP